MVIGHVPPSGMAIKLAFPNVTCSPSFVPRLGACQRDGGIFAAYQERKILAFRGGVEFQFSSTSTPFIRDGGGVAHSISRRKQWPCTAAASKKNFVYPPMTSKPLWWWRSLACVPYLIPLHEAWRYAEYVYRLQPFMEKFDFLADPFLVTYDMLPRWVTMVFFFAVYYMVARRKELPHFLRFHICLSVLLAQAVAGMGIVCGWMPGVVFKGRMSYLWAALAFAEIMTVLHCMQCSLRGMYSDVPFISDSTYITLSM